MTHAYLAREVVVVVGRTRHAGRAVALAAPGVVGAGRARHGGHRLGWAVGTRGALVAALRRRVGRGGTRGGHAEHVPRRAWGTGVSLGVGAVVAGGARRASGGHAGEHGDGVVDGILELGAGGESFT